MPLTVWTAKNILRRNFKYAALVTDHFNLNHKLLSWAYQNQNVDYRHNVLPIVMGARASEYAAAAPHNSYVHVEEFAGAEELAAYLHRLDEDDNLYNSYFKWKVTHPADSCY